MSTREEEQSQQMFAPPMSFEHERYLLPTPTLESPTSWSPYLPGCDHRLEFKEFNASRDGKPTFTRPIHARTASSRETGDRYAVVSEESLYGAHIFAVQVGDLVGALKRSWPRKRPPVEQMVDRLARLALRADEALATCTGTDAGYLATGLLRCMASAKYTGVRPQDRGRRNPDGHQEVDPR
jgi:hypothetical protein